MTRQTGQRNQNGHRFKKRPALTKWPPIQKRPAWGKWPPVHNRKPRAKCPPTRRDRARAARFETA
jgi:hypothetical protein